MHVCTLANEPRAVQRFVRLFALVFNTAWLYVQDVLEQLLEQRSVKKRRGKPSKEDYQQAQVYFWQEFLACKTSITHPCHVSISILLPDSLWSHPLCNIRPQTYVNLRDITHHFRLYQRVAKKEKLYSATAKFIASGYAPSGNPVWARYPDRSWCVIRGCME